MIFTLEGPDKSGKTTLFQRLQGLVTAKFVPSIPIHRDLFPLYHHMESHTQGLWSHLYDSSMTVVTDRHFSVSGPVYARVHGRPVPKVSPRWLREVFVLYLDSPADVLRSRHAADGGDELFDASLYEVAREHYARQVKKFRYCWIDGTRGIVELTEELSCLIRSMQ